MAKNTVIIENDTDDDFCGECKWLGEDVDENVICIIAPLTKVFPWNQILEIEDKKPKRCDFCIQKSGAQDENDFLRAQIKVIGEKKTDCCEDCANWELTSCSYGHCSELKIDTEDVFYCAHFDGGDQ